MGKSCVYTCIMGGYEKLNEQPIAKKSNIPFVCFTDDRGLTSNSWEIVHLSPFFKTDFVRSQRVVKLQPHKYLSEFDKSLYIDNSVILKESPELIFKTYSSPSGFGIFKHSFHDTLLDEFKAVSSHCLDDKRKILEQLIYYYEYFPDILSEHPLWGGVMIREHHNSKVAKTLDFWLAHVLRYTRRDQLSLNLTFKQNQFKCDTYSVDLMSSWFHSWPHVVNRKNNIRKYPKNMHSFFESYRLNKLLFNIERKLISLS